MDQFSDLVRQGLQPAIAQAIARSLGGAGLLPLQRDVLASGALLARPADLLVSAPTASGKTLVAELAMIHGLAPARPAWYLVPTRALAEQKAAEFQRRWHTLGIRVACSTRERRSEDEAILRGEREIVVTVYEKALGMLARQADLLGRISTITLDEAQLLGDIQRGPAIDFFLAQWRAMPPPKPRLIALSAVTGNADELASILGLEHVTTATRVAPLREGILDLASGGFRWRDAESGGEGTESLAPGSSGSTGDEARWATLEHLAALDSTAPLLLFCATRNEAHAAAYRLAERSAFELVGNAAEALAELPRDLSRERLEELLPAGIGLHTGDMPPGQRAIVEEAFQRGELPILVATPTLEQGVNLAAGTVVHSPLMMESGRAGRPTLVPISRARFANQGGRAGREAGRVGRSILFARNAVEADQMWRQLIEAPLERIEPAWGLNHLVRGIATILAESSPRSEDALREVVGLTLAASQRSADEVAASVRAALEAGAREGLWHAEKSSVPEGGTHWRASGLGECMARTSVQPATIRQWAALLAPGETTDLFAPAPSKIACLFALNLAAEWEHFPLRIEASDRRRNLWPSGLREALEERPGVLEARLLEMLAARGGAPYACHQAARRTLLMSEWIEGLPITELELRHGLSSGLMVRLATDAAWLAGAAAEVAGAIGAPEVVVGAMEDTCERLAALVGPMNARPANRPVVHELEKTTSADPAPAPNPEPATVRRAWSLRFPARDRGAVIFNNERTRLSPLPYQLLLLLASRAGEAVSYTEIHETLWPDAAVEQQMIPHHRRAAERSLGFASGELIATEKRWGLRLRMEPDQVAIEAPPAEEPERHRHLLRDSG